MSVELSHSSETTNTFRRDLNEMFALLWIYIYIVAASFAVLFRALITVRCLAAHSLSTSHDSSNMAAVTED